MKAETTRYLNNEIKIDRLWKEIGCNYDNIQQCINEFLDNSISSMRSAKTLHPKIEIKLIQDSRNPELITLQIEDSGTGLETPEQAISLYESSHSTIFNEHGMGAKQALAAANPGNNAWSIFYRTEELKDEGKYACIKAPYVAKRMPERIYSESKGKWPGNPWGKTLIKVECDYRLFKNLIYEVESVKKYIGTSLIDVADRIYENVGFYYAPMLETHEVDIWVTFVESDGKSESHQVKPLVPVWEYSRLAHTTDDKINVKYGKISRLPDRERFNNSTSTLYYKATTQSSGIEIRLNGRCIENNVFLQVYGKKNSYKYKYFLAQMELTADSLDDLPQTKTQKNGFKFGDKRLVEIYDWMRKTLEPFIRKSLKEPKITEYQCVVKLADILRKKAREDNRKIEIKKESATYRSILNQNFPRMDLLVREEGRTTLYECKKDEASYQDVFQLFMYGIGMLTDEEELPNEMILVAQKFSFDVRKMAQLFNNWTLSEKQVNIKLKTWNEFEPDFQYNLLRQRKEFIA